MELQRSSIIDTPGGRMVEMLFADKLAPEEYEAQIRFVVPVSVEGYPRTAEAQEEALRNVQTVLTAEIRSLEGLR